MSVDASEEREGGLKRSLGTAQIVMIGLGGSIGTGLFMGSGLAVGYAGPAVIVSYALAGFVALVMVFSLSEMAVVHPTAGSLGTYAEIYLNPWAGFVVRYTYWIAQVIAVGGEAVAAGLYMQYWFPTVPVWIWALGLCVVLLYFNSRSVGNFGTLESWLALIKVVAIVLFIILGLAAITGFGRPAVGLHNLTGLPGGFLPKGISGLWMAVTVGIFSFYGIEVIAVTAGETKNPEVAIPAALRTMLLRLFLFYVLAIIVIVTIIPWTDTGVKVVAQSPFVTVFQHSGIRHAAGIMNFVVISAALSSMNTDIYLCSRMLFSLSRGGYAPRQLGGLSRARQPRGGDSRVGGLRADCRSGLQVHPERLRRSLRRRALRRDSGVDVRVCQPLELSPPAQRGGVADTDAVFSLAAVRGARHAGGDSRDHGPGLDLRCVLALWCALGCAHLAELLRAAGTANAASAANSGE